MARLTIFIHIYIISFFFHFLSTPFLSSLIDIDIFSVYNEKKCNRNYVIFSLLFFQRTKIYILTGKLLI